MSPTVIHLKAKKSLALRKHPPYLEMVNDALVTLKERNGSSQSKLLSSFLLLLSQSQKHPPRASQLQNLKQLQLNLLRKLKPVAKAKLAPKAKPEAKTFTLAPANKIPAAKPKAKAGSAKEAAKPNPTPKGYAGCE
ncbi:histone H1 [Tanacetum coccineum]